MRLVSTVGVLVAIVLAACASNDGVEAVPSPADPPPADDGTTLPPATPARPEAPEVVDTPPLDLAGVAERTWTFFAIPGAQCRDGSPAGFSVSLSRASKKLVLYLNGGGACFNAFTCGANPSSVEDQRATATGIFARGRAENPVGEWTHVFVPYCTGDVFAGNNPAGDVPGVGPQKFVGYANMKLFLAKLAATFPDVERVLLTGTSAGGFGAAANYGQALRAFPSIPVNLLDDSGPPMGEPPLAQCLQDRWKELWRLDTTVLADCGAACAGPNALLASTTFWSKASPRFAQGIVSATADLTIRAFFGFGASACRSYALVSASQYAAGLVAVRDANAASPSFGMYTYGGTQHTILQTDGFYATSLGPKTIAAWVRDIVERDVATNVGP